MPYTPRWVRTVPDNPCESDLGYLAGIMDGEGYFVTSIGTNSLGLRVGMTDQCVIEKLHKTFGGAVRERILPSGKVFHIWQLARRQDLRYILPRLYPHLVAKKAQAAAMWLLIRHLDRMPRYDRPTRSCGGHKERARRRKARAQWTNRRDELKLAIKEAR